MTMRQGPADMNRIEPAAATTAGPTLRTNRPYPGLRPFSREESDRFFGREEQIDQLLDKLAEIHFLAVLSASGSGKSSLVRAGLLPALDSGVLIPPEPAAAAPSPPGPSPSSAPATGPSAGWPPP